MLYHIIHDLYHDPYGHDAIEDDNDIVDGLIAKPRSVEHHHRQSEFIITFLRVSYLYLFSIYHNTIYILN